MSDQSDRIVKKLWSYCQVLRDDGLSYQDYLEQLTFLLFLKMADERAELTGETQPIPKGDRPSSICFAGYRSTFFPSAVSTTIPRGCCCSRTTASLRRG